MNKSISIAELGFDNYIIMSSHIKERKIKNIEHPKLTIRVEK